jgi:GNAT superfamily N-acetyltransferase
MKKFAVHRLSESARATLARHFNALPAQDRSLRFGMALGPTVIAAYVDQMNLERDAVLGVHDERNALVGVAHVAIEDDHAELALSVLPGHRRRGIGSALFRRAIAHARIRRMLRLIMHCRTANVPIMLMAHKFGMVVVENGRDADAFSTAPGFATVWRATQYATDTGALLLDPRRTVDRDALTRILYYDLFSSTATMMSRISCRCGRIAPPVRSIHRVMEEYSRGRKRIWSQQRLGAGFSRRQPQSCSSFLPGCIPFAASCRLA